MKPLLWALLLSFVLSLAIVYWLAAGRCALALIILTHGLCTPRRFRALAAWA